MSDPNYQVYSPSRDQSCGHMHHSKKKAQICAEHLGWEDAVCQKIRRQNFKRDSIPEYVGVAYDNTDVYEATLKVKFIARSPEEIGDLTDKMQRVLNNNVNAVVQTDVVVVRKVEE